MKESVSSLSGILRELATFPERLQAHFALVPENYTRWSPDSWAGVPSEPLNAIEQICHVRDVEVLGYHVRLQRMLCEPHPSLKSLDAVALARDRDYASADPAVVLADFRCARRKTVELVSGLAPQALLRTGTLDGYGALTVSSLVHYLCSHDHQHVAGLQWLLGKISAQRAD